MSPNRIPELKEYLVGCYKDNTGEKISLE